VDEHPPPSTVGRVCLVTGAIELDGDRDFDAEFLAACDQVVAGTWPLTRTGGSAEHG
jgi:hypothetical protein